MSQSQTPNVTSLFNTAQQSGDMSMAAMQALNVPDIGQNIQNALGVPAIQVTTAEVFLTGMLIDDSGSIRFEPGNTEKVREGVNAVIDALMASKTRDNILMHCRYLNGSVLYPFTPLPQAVRLTQQNYNPNGGTPLYDETAIMLGTVLAKVLEFALNGQPVRSATLIVTDGADEHSHRQTASSVASIVADLLKQEMHIVAAMGIDDGGRTDFWKVFTGWSRYEIEQAKAAGTFADLDAKGGMGIQPRWVLTPGNNPSEIRQAFQVFSQSAQRASQGAASFSQQALGGFGNNP